MNNGRLAQVGTPGELYHRPRTSFVASFIGQTNLLPGRVVGRNGQTVRVQTAAGVIMAAASGVKGLPDSVQVSVRPEQMRIVKDTAASAGQNRITGTAVENTFLGETSEHVLEVNGGGRVKVISAPPLLNVPEQMSVEFDAEDVTVLAE
jgi:spermidine/putrescine transport system ATP-binding protein